jgi:hypothetical protein
MNCGFACLLLAAPLLAQTGGEPPTSWIDPDTGHRVVRLTREPGSASLYFNQNGYTADGKRLVYTTPDGISVLDIATQRSKQVVQGSASLIDAGRRNQRVYYVRDNAAFSTDVDSGQTRRIATLPRRGSISTVNADETLLAGVYIEGDGQDYDGNRTQQAHGLLQPLNKEQMDGGRLAARLPIGLFTINIQTGAIKTIHKSTDWLNHLLFSPTDSSLILFCHEGPWHKVDRIWTIRADARRSKRFHYAHDDDGDLGMSSGVRTEMTIWYDLQTPRGEDFGWRLTGSIRASGPGITCSATSGQYTSTALAMETGRRRRRRSGASGRARRTGSGFICFIRRSFQMMGRSTRGSCSRASCVRAPGEHVEAPVSAGTECQLHTRSEMGRVSVEHDWADIRVCGRAGEGDTLVPGPCREMTSLGG